MFEGGKIWSDRKVFNKSNRLFCLKIRSVYRSSSRRRCFYFSENSKLLRLCFLKNSSWSSLLKANDNCQVKIARRRISKLEFLAFFRRAQVWLVKCFRVVFGRRQLIILFGSFLLILTSIRCTFGIEDKQQIGDGSELANKSIFSFHLKHTFFVWQYDAVHSRIEVSALFL